MNKRALEPGWVQKWNDFCIENSCAWFRHTTPWIEYTVEYCEEYDPICKSFLLTYAKKIVGICPLVLTNHDEHRELSFGGTYGSTPVVGDETAPVAPKTVEKRLFTEVDRIARDCNVSRVAFRKPPLAPGTRDSTRSVNNFQKYGYLDSTVPTRVVDLDRPLSALIGDLRESFRDEIDAAASAVEPTVYDRERIERPIFEAYRRLHHKDAGMVTRSRRTFDLMFEWIQSGDAFLVGVKHDGEFVEFAYFLKFNENAYYTSAASDPEFEEVATGHLLQWTAIEWMHANGIAFYELGPQYYHQQMTSPSTEKTRNISFFKRGFGGHDVPQFRGEKYYDADYFREVYDERLESCAEYIESEWGLDSEHD